MNEIISNNCVSNRNRCVQILILCSIFMLMSSTHSSMAQSESIEFEYQSKYPELAVEDMVYADPYYAVLLRGKYQRTIQFYLRDGDSWILHHQKIVDMPEEQQFLSCQANNSLMVIKFFLKDTQYGCQVIDVNTDDGAYDYIVMPKEELNFDGEIFPYSPAIGSLHIQERTIVFLADNIFTRISYDEALNQVEHNEYVVPSEYSITDFDFLGENLLFVSNPTADINVPLLRGVGIARFNSSNELVFDNNLWYFKTESIDGKEIYRKPEAIRTLGTTSFIVRETGELSWLSWPRPTEGAGYEMLIIDWSDGDNPKLVQTIGEPDVDWEYISNAISGYDANESMLALQIPNTSQAVLSIYEPIGGSWEKSSSIDLSFPRYPYISLGGNAVILKNSQELSIFDLSDPSTPREIDPPVNKTDRFYYLNYYNEIFYYIDNHGAFTAARFDESNNINIVDQVSLPDGWQVVGVNYGLCALRKDKEIKIIPLNANGGFGEELITPEYPKDDSITNILDPMWNDEYLVIVYIQYTTEDHNYPSPTEFVIQVYSRDGDQIGSMVSMFSNSSREFSSIMLIEDFFIATERLTGDAGQYELQYKLLIYPLDSDNPAESVIEYDIPINENVVNQRRMRVVNNISYNSELQYIAYSSSAQSGIIDFSDAQNPKHLNFFLPASDSVHWNNGRLFLKQGELIDCYRIEDDKAVLIGSMNDLAVSSSSNPIFSEDDIYLSRSWLGMERYKMTVDQTNVENWLLY